MNVGKLLFGEFQSRWQVICKKSSSSGQKIFAAMEIFCFPVSMLSILLLLLQVIIYTSEGGDSIPVWWVDYVSPILLSGAVGYLTNWLAIMMLFRPYEPVKWLFFWPQGMIPRNKANVAKSMGNEVGNNLLSPERLVEELSNKISSFLNKTEIIDEIKNKIQSFLAENKKSIIDFLIPEIEKSLLDAIDRFITPDNIRKFWSEGLQPKLNSDETRAEIASKILEIGRANSGNLSTIIRQRLQVHLTQSLGPLIAPIAVPVIMNFFADQNQVRQMLDSWLGDKDTQNMLQNKMLLLGEKINEWVNSREAETKLGSLVEDSKGALRNFLREYLHEALPVFVNNALESEGLWRWFEEKFIPNTRDNLLKFIQEHRQDIVNALQLDKRIENAINAQDVKKFHNMINNIAAQHLGAIQVLGYVLGILIGGLQLIQTLICK